VIILHEDVGNEIYFELMAAACSDTSQANAAMM
jgi:hypothetical protein